MADDLERDLDWARRHMALTEAETEDLPRLDGVHLACSIHLELKSIPSVESMLLRGAEVFLATCNPATVRNEVVERLVSRGATAHAWNGMSPAVRRPILRQGRGTRSTLST